MGFLENDLWYADISLKQHNEVNMAGNFVDHFVKLGDVSFLEVQTKASEMWSELEKNLVENPDLDSVHIVENILSKYDDFILFVENRTHTSDHMKINFKSVAGITNRVGKGGVGEVELRTLYSKIRQEELTMYDDVSSVVLPPYLVIAILNLECSVVKSCLDAISIFNTYAPLREEIIKKAEMERSNLKSKAWKSFFGLVDYTPVTVISKLLSLRDLYSSLISLYWKRERREIVYPEALAIDFHRFGASLAARLDDLDAVVEKIVSLCQNTELFRGGDHKRTDCGFKPKVLNLHNRVKEMKEMANNLRGMKFININDFEDGINLAVELGNNMVMTGHSYYQIRNTNSFLQGKYRLLGGLGDRLDQIFWCTKWHDHDQRLNLLKGRIRKISEMLFEESDEIPGWMKERY